MSLGAGGLEHYLLVSALLLVLGLVVVIVRRNAVIVLMGVELILNAAGLNFVAMAHYTSTGVQGHVVTVFIIMLAAAEAAVALGIVLNLFTQFRTVELDEIHELRG